MQTTILPPPHRRPMANGSMYGSDQPVCTVEDLRLRKWRAAASLLPYPRLSRRLQQFLENRASSDDLLNNMSVHVGQTSIDAVVPNGQTLVVDAKQMQDRRMDVIDLRGILTIERFIAPFV